MTATFLLIFFVYIIHVYTYIPLAVWVVVRGAENSEGGKPAVLVQLKGHYEKTASAILLQLASALAALCPCVKAVTFHDIRRSAQLRCLLLLLLRRFMLLRLLQVKLPAVLTKESLPLQRLA